MTPKEHLIQRLRVLCNSVGGPDAVAQRARISAESQRRQDRSSSPASVHVTSQPAACGLFHAL
jgi:hypothetical protein